MGKEDVKDGKGKKKRCSRLGRHTGELLLTWIMMEGRENRNRGGSRTDRYMNIGKTQRTSRGRSNSVREREEAAYDWV